MPEAVLELQKAGLKEIILASVIPREDVAFVPNGGYLRDEMLANAKQLNSS